MNTYRITELARTCGLSRSTLLHYDRIGLLSPSGRSENGYRFYSERERRHLERICLFRQAGLALEEIRQLLDSDGRQEQQILEKRLAEQSREIHRLQNSQHVLLGLIRAISDTNAPQIIDKKAWTEMLRAAGMDDQAMHRWHAEFESRSPQAHHQFLLSLSISEKDVMLIRKWSRQLDTDEAQMAYFYRIYERLPRQAPGTKSSTLRALSYLKDLPAKPIVLDIGCGSGAQTLDLAGQLAGQITAVDNHQPFLDQIEVKVEAGGFRAKVTTDLQSMFELPYPDESFDLLWAEGSLYIIGVEKGLRTWRRLLAPGGYLVFSEICWVTENPPQQAVDFWQQDYPAMGDADKVLNLAEACGYRVLKQFPLPTEGWQQNYYTPLEQEVNALRQEVGQIPEAKEICELMQKEIDLYRQFGDSYSYVFFILQKT